MSFRPNIRALHRDERGGVLVFMAFALPILILFVSLALDVVSPTPPNTSMRC